MRTSPVQSGDPDELLGTPEFAAWVGISPGWARIMRLRGGGPKFVKVGSAVRYRRGDVLAWLESRTFSATNEFKAA